MNRRNIVRAAALIGLSSLLWAVGATGKSDEWKKSDSDRRLTTYTKIRESSGLQRLYIKAEKSERMKERKCKITAMLRLEYRTTIDGNTKEFESDQPLTIESYAKHMQTVIAEADKIDRIRLDIKDSSTGDCQKR